MNQVRNPHPSAAGWRQAAVSLPFLLVAALLGLTLLGSSGWAQETKAPAPPAAKTEAATPQPEKMLQQACDLLKSAKQFSFKAEVTDDRVYTAGKKLQFALDMEVFVQRPDKLRVNAVGDLQTKEFFYNGKVITLYDKPHNVFGVIEAPANIDAALDHAHKEYGLRVGLADMTGEHACALMTHGIKHALYVGEGLVRGVKCHHLAFDLNHIQWQIWIDAGDKPVIRKLIITQKQLRGAPQWTAYFADWNFAPQFADTLFTFTAPAGASQIKFISLKQAEAMPKKATPGRKKMKKQKGEAS